jgi:hypothetical protein
MRFVQFFLAAMLAADIMPAAAAQTDSDQADINGTAQLRASFSK